MVKGGQILQMENPKPEIIPGKFYIWLSAKCRTKVIFLKSITMIISNSRMNSFFFLTNWNYQISNKHSEMSIRGTSSSD